MSNKPKGIDINSLRESVNEAGSAIANAWAIAYNKNIADAGRMMDLGVELHRARKLIQRLKEELSKVET